MGPVKFQIYVTKADIAKGRREEGETCPVALAVRRCTGHKVFVGYEDVEFFNKRLPIMRLPKLVTVMISNYDKGAPLSPFRFTLRTADKGQQV